MKKLKKLWKNAGFANIGLAIAAIIFFILWTSFGFGDFGMIGFFCSLSACVALNWQAIMQKTTIDDEIMIIVNKAKAESEVVYEKIEKKLEEKIIELKKLIIGLKEGQ